MAGEDQHLDAGEQQEGAEEVKYPVKLRQEQGADVDEHGPHDDSPQHTVKENALLEFGGNGKEAEEGDPDENIVHRQGLLDQVTGQEFQGLFVGDLPGKLAIEVPPEPGAEGEGNQDPDHRPGGRFLNADPVCPLGLEHQEIDGQQGDYQQGEAEIEEGRADGFDQGFPQEWTGWLLWLGQYLGVRRGVGKRYRSSKASRAPVANSSGPGRPAPPAKASCVNPVVHAGEQRLDQFRSLRALQQIDRPALIDSHGRRHQSAFGGFPGAEHFGRLLGNRLQPQRAVTGGVISHLLGNEMNRTYQVLQPRTD